MKVELRQLTVPVQDRQDADALPSSAARTLRLPVSSIRSVKILRRSVDARAVRPAPVYVYHLGVELMPDVTVALDAAGTGNVVPWEETPYAFLRPCPGFAERPVVVGAGPAGLFAALVLAESGARPIVLERGLPVHGRQRSVGLFWGKGVLDPESNVLYGEGGAGMFSDGKLTSRSKDRVRQQAVLDALVACGAPETIAYDASAHLGSDAQPKLLLTLRRRIEALGGSFSFGSRVTGFTIADGSLRGIMYVEPGGAERSLATSHCVLAAGASCREMFRRLYEQGVGLEAKPFAVGVRVEIPQKQVNHAQWGTWENVLEPASFRLTRKAGGGARECYTFCMCPGGRVIPCASGEGMLTTNGMSLSTRGGAWANAAFLVPVSAADTVPGVLDGLRYQEEMERAAFIAGGSDYRMPATTLKGLIDDKAQLPGNRLFPQARAARLSAVFPEPVLHTLKIQIPAMLKLLPGVKPDTAVIYAAETRTSCPVRIVRDENGMSVTTRGLYPAGEGAGYAGGIVSSAIDGLRAAESVLSSR